MDVLCSSIEVFSKFIQQLGLTSYATPHRVYILLVLPERF